MTDLTMDVSPRPTRTLGTSRIGSPSEHTEPTDAELTPARLAYCEANRWPRVELVAQHRRRLIDAEGEAYRLRTGLVFGRGQTRPGFVAPSERVPYALMDGVLVFLEHVGTVAPPTPETPAKARRTSRKGTKA